MFKNQSNRKRGFSMVELVVLIGVLAVLAIVFVPSLLSYVERTRMESDIKAMSEVVNSVSLALADQDTFDEAVYYSATNNFVTYTDSSGVYGAQIADDEYWAPDGSGKATTITFNPTELGSGRYVIADAHVNDMTYGNGSMAATRLMVGCYAKEPQVKFSQMEMGSGVVTAHLFGAVKQAIGETVQLESSTYANSSYTIFILFGSATSDGNQVTVKGSFNGTNLSEGSLAAIGSGTDSYDDAGNAEGTQSGTGTSSFEGSALQGTGSLSYTNWQVADGDFDKEKFWAFCNSLASEPVEIISFSANGAQAGSATPVDVSVAGDGSILAWYRDGVVYVSPKDAGYVVSLPEDSSYLFDSSKTGLLGLTQIVVTHSNTAEVVDMTNIFANNELLVYISGLQNWDTSNVVSAGGMFRSNINLQTIRLDALKFPVCEDMSYMFYQCEKLSGISAGDWDVQLVRDLGYAFYGCSSLQLLDVSNFRTVALTNLAHTFDGCSNVKELELSGWDVTSVTSFNSTFKDCKSADIINVEGWETSAATDMGSMFENCRALLAVDPSKFTTENVTNFSKMFYKCVHLGALDLSTFNTLNATNVSNMFDGMLRLTEIQVGATFSFTGNGRTRCYFPTPTKQYIEGANGTWTDGAGRAWKPANVPSRTAGIYVAIESSLPAILAPRATWWRGATDPSTITSMVFANSSGIPRVYQECFNADVENKGEIKVYVNGRYAYVINCKNARSTGSILLSNDASGMFADFTSLTSLTGLRVLNTINVTNMNNMFGRPNGSGGATGCTQLTFADGLTTWNVQNVTSAQNMFTGIAIKDLDLSKWSFNSLTNMNGMFQSTEIEELNLSGWDVSNVTSFNSMFANSKDLVLLTLKGWANTTASMDSMYAGCTSLTTILISNDIKPATANTTMFNNCHNIVGGYGTPYSGPGSEYAVADSDTENGYYTKFTASGAMSAKLYDTGSVSGAYTLLTADGATVEAWDFSKGERLLEISLSGMPKGEEKTLTITVPTGMYILANSWTGVNNDVSNVVFEQLQNQGTGVYKNAQTGTLTYTIAPYTQNTTITMSVMFDTTLWDKNVTNANWYGTDAMTLDDPIVVSLNDGERIRKISKIKSSAYFGTSSTGYGLANHDSNSNIFIGTPLTTSASAVNLSTGGTSLVQYFKSVNYYTYAYSTDASGNIIYANVTTPTAGKYRQYNWENMSFEILDQQNVPYYNSRCQVTKTQAAKNVLHMTMSKVYTGGGMCFPLPAFTITADDGFVVGNKLTVVSVVEVETFSGQTKKMSTTKNYNIKSDQLNYQTDFSLSGSNKSGPATSYFGDSGYGTVLGSFYMYWCGAQDLTGMNVQYQYDTTTTTGEPNVKVQAARVALPKGTSTQASVVLVDNSGKTTNAYSVTISSTSSSQGAYISTSKVASANGLSGTYYIKSVSYTMPTVTGSTTATHYLYASSSGMSLSSAGTFIGTVRDGSGKSTVTTTFPDGTSKTTSVTSSVGSKLTYSGTINDVKLPSGSSIVAGSNFEIDVLLYAISYPYSNTQLFKNPELYVVLPQGVSIQGAIIGDSQTTATSQSEAQITLVKTTTIDGVLQNVYKIAFADDVWFGYASAGASGITHIGKSSQWVRIMCTTDSSMSNTVIRLVNSLWFKDANGDISIGGSWRYAMTSDKYDVDNDGATTDTFGIPGSSTLSNMSITITPQ